MSLVPTSLADAEGRQRSGPCLSLDPSCAFHSLSFISRAVRFPHTPLWVHDLGGSHLPIWGLTAVGQSQIIHFPGGRAVSFHTGLSQNQATQMVTKCTEVTTREGWGRCTSLWAVGATPRWSLLPSGKLLLLKTAAGKPIKAGTGLQGAGVGGMGTGHSV